MILNEITLSGWRCFADEVTVGPFQDTLNIVHAPNGTGKSTVFEALRLAVFDSYRVSGQEIEGIRPWGRNLSPRVRILFEDAEVDYELTKQFLSNTDAQLRRMESGQFRSLAEGRDADEKLRDLFSGSAPGRGLTKPLHWGLAQILWVPQGQLHFDSISDDLVHNIQAVLGKQPGTGSVGKIENRIDAEYDKYYTASGKTKTGKNKALLLNLEAELYNTEEKLALALGSLESYEQTSKNIQDLEARFRQYHEQTQELSKKIDLLTKDATSYTSIKQDEQRKEQDASLAISDYQRFEQELKSLLDLKAKQANLKQVSEEYKLSLKEAEAHLATSQQVFNEAEDAMQKLQDEESILEKIQHEADQARMFTENSAVLERLRIRLDQVREIDKALQQHRKERAGLIAPDEKTLSNLRRALQEREQVKTRLESQLITVTVTPLQSLSLSHIQGYPSDACDMVVNTPQTIRGDRQVAFRINDLADITASGPVANTQLLRDALAKLESEIESITRAFGNADLETLEDLYRRAVALDGEIRDTETRLETLLGADSTESLEQETARQEAVLQQLTTHWPHWASTPPNTAELAQQAEQKRVQYKENKVAVEDLLNLRRSALEQAKAKKQEQEIKLENTSQQLSEVEDALEARTLRGISVESLESKCNDAAMRRQAALAELDKLKDALARFDGDPAADLEVLKRQRDGIEQEATENRDRLQQEKGRMIHLADANVYSSVVELEERKTVLEEDIARESRHMAAIKLLKETKDRLGKELMSAVIQPVSTAATRMLERVAGSRLGTVVFNESFIPESVQPKIMGDASPVGLDNLSGGEQEQLYLVTRLALAEMLAREQRQMVVMDDVLTATDAGRLGRILDLLEEASEQLQIIVLTCHPERYRALNHACYIDLEALRQ